MLGPAAQGREQRLQPALWAASAGTAPWELGIITLQDSSARQVLLLTLTRISFIHTSTGQYISVFDALQDTPVINRVA